MTAQEILLSASAQGLVISAKGGDLYVRPGNRLSPSLREAIKAAKPDLHQLLLISSPLRVRLSKAVYGACQARGDSNEVAQSILMESLALSESDQRDLAGHFECEERMWGGAQ